MENTTFAVTHTWPDLRNAEYEVLQRLSIAANNIGATMIAIDNDGRPLWASRRMSLDHSKPLASCEIDFMISLHFFSPKLIDTYSYYALWNPPEFYFQFYYEDSIEKLLTHNDCLSCLSEPADAQGRLLFGSRSLLNPEPFINLFHNVPQPYLPPRIGADSRAFYIGINWERGGRSKGRHSGLFELLDRDGLLDIYGPRKLFNFEPWAGFDSYRGELPFDGLATVRAVNQAGICLALSSDAHKRAGLMSNRLFEGLAGGAAVIVDSNPWALKHFGDVAYFIDDSGTAEEVAHQIRGAIDQIRRDPEDALERVRKGQARLTERFSLEGSLQRLAAEHPKRVEHYHKSALRGGTVTVVITQTGPSLDDLMDNLANVARQREIKADVVVICDTDLHAQYKAQIEAAANGSIRKLNIKSRPFGRMEKIAGQMPGVIAETGPAVAEALSEIQTDYFCFLRSDESWFEDHLANLIAAFEKQPDATAAVSGALEQEIDGGKTKRSLASLHFKVGDEELLSGHYTSDFGRFLFKSAVAKETPRDCLLLLDGQEPNLVRLIASLAGRPAESGFATYLCDTAKTELLDKSVVPLEHQHQYIRDAVAFDNRWRTRLSAGKAMPKFMYAYSNGAPVRPDLFPHPMGVTRNLPLDQLVDLTVGGQGAKYLQDGFSMPEPAGTWIEGASGTLDFYCSEKGWANSEDRDLVLVMRGRAANGTGRAQHCTIVVNGMSLAYVEAPEVFTTFSIRLPRNLFADEGRVRVQLIPNHAEPGYGSDGHVVDQREIGLQLRQFGIRSRQRPSRPQLEAGVSFDIREGGAVQEILREGIFYPETNWTWIAEGSAQLSFEIINRAADAKLVLWLSGRDNNRTKRPQTMRVSVNGVSGGRFELRPALTRVEIALTPLMIDEDGVCNVGLEFAHAQPVVDEEGDIIDPRRLSAQLWRIMIEGAAPVAPKAEAPPASAPSFLARVRNKIGRMLRS